MGGNKKRHLDRDQRAVIQKDSKARGLGDDKTKSSEKREGTRLKQYRRFSLELHGISPEWGGPEPQRSPSSGDEKDGGSLTGSTAGSPSNTSSWVEDTGDRPGTWRGEALIIDTVRDSLERQEDSIIVSLVERAQYGYNRQAYYPTSFPFTRFNGSLVEYLILENETAHAKIGKYKSLDETAFYPRLLMEPIMPPFQYPRVLHPAAASININEKVWKVYFDELLPKLVKEEDDGKCVSSAECDVAVLKALSKRIHYGKYVAEAKYQEAPDKYEPAIRAQDKDKLMEMLTYPKVEKKVTDRVKTKAMMYGQRVDPDDPLKVSDTLAPKINPELAGELYGKWVMPLTKEVQVQYLLRRLD